MKKKSKNSNWPRTAIQWAVILFVIVIAALPLINKAYTPDFEAYCPFGGVQALGSYLLNQSLACTMTSAQIVMGILMIIGILLFSKLFCGYICPIGTISEWLGKLGDKLKIRYTIKGLGDKLLRSLKYILLFITFYFSLGSSELFCKKFDPYYAVTTGFSIDVVALYAGIAIALVILGSIFIRLFFCKYICPFGALANIFKSSLFFVAVIGIYVIIRVAGVELSYVWPLAVACVGGYVLELTKYGRRIFPLSKITRNEDTCINCSLCTKKCPQAIDVANMKVVKDADCNLCGECITACPVDNTVQINKSKKYRWTPVIAVLVLVALGMALGEVVEVPTIDQQYVTPDEMVNTAVYTQEGLRSIKCYGSSMAFAGKMKRLNGVYGVATYVGTHKVRITYDSTLLNTELIQKAIFTPMKTPVKPLAKDAQTVKKVSVLLDNFFDSFDYNYLAILLKQQSDAVGLQIEFGCPVNVYIYFPGDAEIDLDELKVLLESKSVTWESAGKETSAKLGYKVAGKMETEELSRGEYIALMFAPYVARFNDYEKYDSEVIRTLRLPLGKNISQQKKYPYMVSHLSNNGGIIEFRTGLDSSFTQVLDIQYVDSLVSADEILNLLRSDSLQVSYKNGTKGTVENMFDFSGDEEME